MEYDDMQEIIKWMNKSSEKSESEIENKIESFGFWDLIPENVMIEILRYLSVKDIISCSEVSKRWNFISNDSLLWKYKFQLDFAIDNGIQRKPGKKSSPFLANYRANIAILHK